MIIKTFASLLLVLFVLQKGGLADSFMPRIWDATKVGSAGMKSLINVTGSHVKGAHDAEFVCVGERAYVVAVCNDQQGSENQEWPFIDTSMSIVNFKTLGGRKENRLRLE